MNKQKVFKIVEYIIWILLILGIILSIGLMVYRCFLGTEFTDEAYYVSNAMTMMKGNLPFAFNMSRQSGMSLVLIPFLWLYQLAVPSLEGVFLYTRIAFLIWRLVILTFTLFLLRKKYSRFSLIFAFAILVPYSGSTIHNFSYNTVSLWLFVFVATLLYVYVDCMDTKKRYGMEFVAGFCMCMAVMAHPLHLFSAVALLVIHFCFAPKEIRIKDLIAETAGAFTQGVVVLTPIILNVGFKKLFYGIETIFFYQQYKPGTATFFEVMQGLATGLKEPLIQNSLCWLAVFLALKFFIRFNKKELASRDKVIISTMVVLMIALDETAKNYNSGSEIQIAIVIFEVGFFISLWDVLKKKKDYWVYLYIPLFLFIMAEMFLANPSRVPLARMYFFVILVFALYLEGMRSSSNWIKGSLILVAGFTVITFGIVDFGYIYRDEGIISLTAQVKGTEYNGLLTTPERALAIIELDAFLEQNINPDETVCFKDNVPVAYTLYSDNMLDIRTWDEMNYSYGCNDPISTFRYFYSRGEIPDKIIYIDYGCDEVMSIDANGYRFSNFVKKYYDMEKKISLNDTFSQIVIYTNNGKFDGDFEKLFEH